MGKCSVSLAVLTVTVPYVREGKHYCEIGESLTLSTIINIQKVRLNCFFVFKYRFKWVLPIDGYTDFVLKQIRFSVNFLT